MIRKLRWKFVAVCMGLVALVLSAVFGAAYHAVRQNIEDLSRQMLYQVLREDSGRGAVPNPAIEIGGDRVLLPYFTVNIWGDTAYINCIRSIREPELEYHFYRVLHRLGLPVKVESNMR